MIQGLTVDAMMNLPENSPVWVAVNEDTRNCIGIGDRGTNKPVILVYLKKEDAAHYGRLLRENGSADRMVDIEEVPLHDFSMTVKEKDEMFVSVIPPNAAMKFFEEFKDSLWEYYE